MKYYKDYTSIEGINFTVISTGIIKIINNLNGSTSFILKDCNDHEIVKHIETNFKVSGVYDLNDWYLK